MPARSQQYVAIAATVVVVGGGAAFGWHQWHGSDEEQKAAPVTPQITVADAHAVAQALAKMPSKPQNLIATDVYSAVGPQIKNALPAGATVNANESTWHPDGLGGGTIPATITAPGAPTTVYTVMMIKEPTGWKVVGTVPMDAVPPPIPKAVAPPQQPAAPAAATVPTPASKGAKP
jgi:hypothetical protein